MELRIDPLINNGESFLFSTGGGIEVEKWRDVIEQVACRWGEVQKTELEYELAGMRKTLGELWETCATSSIPANIQKVWFAINWFLED